MTRAARAGLVLAAVGGCTGASGTVVVTLTSAPGTTPLAQAAALRVTITQPRTVTTVPRGSDGSFAVDVAFDAIGAAGAIVVEGLDGSGGTIAVGETPPFPLAAVTANVTVYLAPPMSVGPAPLALDTPLIDITAVPLAYGGVLAGGVTAPPGNAASAELHVYNAFDHTFAAGLPLPAPRFAMAGALGASGQVYLFGGADAAGSTAGSLWRFDPSVAPAGAVVDLGTHADLARESQVMLPVGIEQFVISGVPALDLDDSAGSGVLTARTDLLNPPATAAAVLDTSGTQTAIFAGLDAGSGGALRLRGGAVDSLSLPGAARTSHAVAALGGGRILVIGGLLGDTDTTDAFVIDAATGSGTTIVGALSTGREHPTVAVGTRYVIVASGRSPQSARTADVLDATTLARVTTVPLPATCSGPHALALALPNEQVLFAGCTDDTGVTSLLELFTPDAPP